ncbi:M1 family peptidase [Flavobacteriaceae bacterium R38]|nr:M1 family peptidase [Flavobacteriaceae bacterium R38]
MKINNLNKTWAAVFCLSFLFFSGKAQKHYDRYETIDVLHYTFDLKLSDASDVIESVADVKIRFKKGITKFNLDLVKKDTNGKGMEVLSVTESENQVPFTHNDTQLVLNINTTQPDEVRTYKIAYKGVPGDGLIISKNKYDERTFFGDNWPDRGKNWLPVVDHPSDKATVEWVITAPSHYQTIGNGVLTEKTNVSGDLTLSRWKMTDPVPTKVMVIGASRFAVENQGDVYGTPVSSWVYPQDRDNGFSDYALATPIMDYFINHIGPYPFKKLANVQSKTRFGGMENAGNIFYAENSVTGDGRSEALIAHEIAHQWFGNSASEKNWHHIWLSEGFATYFTNLYLESKYGRDELVEKVKEQRERIIDYAKRNFVPIVNPQIDNYMQLLNPNSYQKGGWVLHMLRRELGDQLFWKGIREYYKKYKYNNALSGDLQKVMEDVSGKNLSVFFEQWLMKAGQPKLAVKWNSSRKSLKLEVNQKQENVNYTFPLDIQINYKDGSTVVKTVQVSDRYQKFDLPVEKQVNTIVLDPDAWLLYELEAINKK